MSTNRANRGTPDGAGWHQVVDQSIDGEEIRVWERPSYTPGTPCVALVHGFEESWQSWRALADFLPRELHLFSLDLPWRNGSRHRWADGGASPTWLRRSLELLPRPANAVVAHSFGATTLLDLLARRTAVAAVPAVLVAPVYRPHDTPVDPRFFDEAIHRFRDVLAEGLRAQLGSRAARIPKDILATMTDKVRERVEPHGFLQFYTMLARTPKLALRDIAVPVLMVSGSGDPSAPPAAVSELSARVAHFSLVQDPGLSHFCQQQQPLQVAAAITDHFVRLGLCRSDKEVICA
ncbi:alpha/beta fold hydrolase [Streptomyces sp. CA-181903]|uniref:alpha/beta fold hydrolase n=1 Tax=Streptomyces sp. CA-181903 TaxID=3240055 RepID=UPI003D907B6E